MGSDGRTLSVAQACTEAGVSRRTIYNWVRADKVRHTRTAGGSLRIYADSLFMDETRSEVVRQTREAESRRRLGAEEA